MKNILVILTILIGLNAQTNIFPSTGKVGIGTPTPSKLLDVSGDANIGNLNARHYLKISSKEWPEIRFQTPTSNEQIRIGIASTSNPFYDVKTGDFYIFSNNVNTMPIIVQETGNVLLTPKSGNVGIGTTNPQNYKLAVNGTIAATKIKITANVEGADFVFEDDYNLRSLTETEKFIKKNKHLPEIPSAKDMKENGLDMSEFQIKLLQKIEEQTLHMIAMNKKLEEQNKRLKTQENEIKKLKSVLK